MKLIKDITSFIFVEDKPEKADIIFITGGSWPEPAEKAAELWNEGYAQYILPSGKFSYKRGYFPGSKEKADIYNGNYETESEFMSEVLKINGVNPDSIIREDRAENTYDNAFYSREVTDGKNMKIKKAIICCKSFHARRSLMFYNWAYPDVEFIICPIDTQNISKDNWFETDDGIERVMTELARCGNQLKESISTYRSNNN